MNRNRFLVFCFFLFTILLIRLGIYYQGQPVIPIGREVTVLGKIVSEPVFSDRFQSFWVQIASGTKIYVTEMQEKEYLNGEDLRLTGSLEKRVLNKNFTIYAAFLPQITSLGQSKNPFLAVMSFIRQKVTDFYNRNLPSDFASLLLGIVFGIKGSLSKEFLESLQSAGVMHVIAASGMNVSLVGGFLSAFLILFVRRQWAIVITILGLIFYAFLAGLSASILRATIMGILVFSSQILGRQYLASYGLFLAGFLMLFISPSLVLDVGFQLSFMATAGLLYLRPIFDLLFSKNLGKLWVSEDLFTTIAAQLATFPILFTVFGNYSPWSIVVNAFVLWTIPILMILGGVGAILSFVLEPLARLLIYLCLPLLLYFEKIVKLVPVSRVQEPVNSHWSMVVGYYLILVSLFLWFKLKGKHNANKVS
jgi:ComEC/Rec2-related protein